MIKSNSHLLNAFPYVKQLNTVKAGAPLRDFSGLITSRFNDFKWCDKELRQ